MSNLYHELSAVYEAMYHTFIDYEEEFQFYYSILKKHGCKSVLEAGCGTGNLAGRFRDAGMEYSGMDISENMLEMAIDKNPGCVFIHGDMRNFELNNKVESTLITARSLSYLVPNSDVYAAFNAIKKNIHEGGILCFDFIDASRFMPYISEHKTIRHYAAYKGIKYFRDTRWGIDLEDKSWTFNWQADYYIEEENGAKLIGSDNSSLRAFTADDIEILLKLNGYELMELIDRPSYAFDTFVAVARNGKRAF